jgi:RNA polymerase sigma-B factor
MCRLTAEVSDLDADDEVVARFRRLRERGDRTLRNELIEEHRWIAANAARRFADKGEPIDDLVQVAMLGVLKAVERFDPEVGVPFVSFAMPTVVGELRRHFRDSTWAMRVPRRVKDLRTVLTKVTEDLAARLGRPPTPDELARHMHVEVEDVLEALEAGAAYRPGPLAPPTETEDASAQGRALRIEDPLLEGAVDRVLVDQLLEGLPERERRIVELRFFAGLSQSQIADEIGLSQVHVSRLLRSSLTALQRQLRGT